MKTPLLHHLLLVGGISLLLPTPGTAGEPASSHLPQPVHNAPASTGFYFEGFGGVLFLDDLSGHGGARLDAEFDTGWLAGGTLGYALMPGLSLEVEGVTGEADLEGLSINGNRSRSFSGDLGYTQVAVNLIYEFGPQNPITPYVGFGIGAGFADADFHYSGSRLNDDDAAFLYQFIGGVNMDIAPNAKFFAEYRFGSLDEFTLGRSGGGVTFDELESHQALFGVQITF